MRCKGSTAALVLLLFFCSAAGLAQYSGGYHPKIRTAEQANAERKRLVSAYCRADFEGTRLNSEGSGSFKELLTFKLSPDFTSFAVVARFDVSDDTSKATVNVSYPTLGRWENSMGFHRLRQAENVEFHIVDHAGDLRIDSIDPAEPRVSVRAALVYLRKQLAAASSDAQRELLDQAIKLLSALEGPGSAPNATKPPENSATPKR